jgi:hypothetical protein
MSNIGEDRYVFVSEWYDQMAALIRSYQLRYFPADKTLEMVFSLLSMTSKTNECFSKDANTHKSPSKICT